MTGTGSALKLGLSQSAVSRAVSRGDNWLHGTTYSYKMRLMHLCMTVPKTNINCVLKESLLELTKKQIRYGFWYYHGEKDFPPNSITEVEDYRSSERLSLVITQLERKSSEQNILVKKWIEKLPTLLEVKYLWFHSRVNQQMFDAACEMPNLEGLFVKWSGIKDISKIQSAKKLIHLHLGDSAQIESIEYLKNNKNLITLDLENLKKIRDFSVLSTLSNLEGLGIDGGMYTTQVVETLKPIGKLINLRYLTLTNTRIADKSLDPLLNLKELVRYYGLSSNLADSEYLKLGVLPNFKYGNTAETLQMYIEQKKRIADLVKKNKKKKV